MRVRCILRALLCELDGNAVIEFGLLAPLLSACLVPVIDVGMGFYQSMQVGDAAQAGAQYAMAHGWNSSAVVNAVTHATALSSINASPAPSSSCGCPQANSVVSAACGTTCSDGHAAGTYVTVSAQAIYQPLVPYPGIGSSVTLSAQAIARIQ